MSDWSKAQSPIACDMSVLSREQLCCPFLNFAINVEAEGGPVTLRLRGREGVKDFVREEISGLLGNVIGWDKDEEIGAQGGK